MHDKEGGAGGGTQFTCFTSTKVQMLTHLRSCVPGGRPFQLVCSMLRSKIFQDKTQTLAEAELQGQTLLIAQPIE